MLPLFVANSCGRGGSTVALPLGSLCGFNSITLNSLFGAFYNIFTFHFIRHQTNKFIFHKLSLIISFHWFDWKQKQRVKHCC